MEKLNTPEALKSQERDIFSKAEAIVNTFGEPVDGRGKKVSVSVDGTIGVFDCASFSILSGFRENEIKINYELKERSGKIRLNSFIFKDNGLTFRSVKERNPEDYFHFYSQIESGDRLEFYELLGLQSLLSKAETKLNEKAQNQPCLEPIKRSIHSHVNARHRNIYNRRVF